MKTVKLLFEGEELVELPILHQEDSNESISKVIPSDGYVIIVGHLKAKTLDILANKAANTQASVKYYVGSISDTINSFNLKLNIGDRIKLDNPEQALLNLDDTTNQYSLSKIKQLVEKDPLLVAANAIVRNKDKSKVGLNIENVVDLNSVKQLLQEKDLVSKGSSNKLYQDTYVDIVMYYLTHRSSIIAKIIE